MTRRAFVLLFAFVLSAPAFAQTGGAPADPISGVWTDGASRGVELKFDGKSALTGRLNPKAPNPIPIKSGTFDAKTGAFKLEAERTVNGATQTMTIEGKLANGKLAGTYKTSGTEQGAFEFSKEVK